MKIAVIMRKLNVSGGAQRIALNVAYELQKQGHLITLYTFFYDAEKCFPELLKNFTVVTMPRSQHHRTFGLLGILSENRMARAMAYMIDRNTELLYPDDGPAHHVAYYYKKYIRNIPSVWNMNELPTMRWPLELLSIMENRAYHDIPWRPLFLKKFLIRSKTRYERGFIRAQNAIVVFDKFHQNMLKRYAGVESVVIPSGVDVEAFHYSLREPPRHGSRLNLLSSGIFLSYRRFEDIIEAMPHLIEKGLDPCLTILGDYNTDVKYHRALKALCVEKKVEQRVVFFGRYSDEQLQKYLAESHIFIYPHLQSQGIAVNETVASGLPTIVTPLSGTYETVEDGKHVLFALPRDPASIALAIVRLVDAPELYQSISSEGSKHMKEHFSWKRQAEEVAALMERLIHQT